MYSNHLWLTEVAAYHRKALDIQTNFSIVNSATEAGYNRLSVVNCTDDEVKVEFSKPDPEAGKAALGALNVPSKNIAKVDRCYRNSSDQQTYDSVGRVLLPRTYGIYRRTSGQW